MNIFEENGKIIQKALRKVIKNHDNVKLCLTDDSIITLPTGTVGDMIPFSAYGYLFNELPEDSKALYVFSGDKNYRLAEKTGKDTYILNIDRIKQYLAA